MKLSPAYAAIVLLLTACAKPVLPSTATPLEPLRTPMELPFWLEDGKTAKDDPRIVSTDGHPCGGVAYLKVTSLPESNDVVRTDAIVEFDQSGHELTVWRTPTDFVVDQIRDNLIGVSNNHDQYLWIDPHGQLYRRPQMPSQELESIDCPSLERFHDSKYLRCLRIKDSGTSRNRFIAWQGVCT